MARPSSKMIRIGTREFFKGLFIHHCEIGPNMTSKYAMASAVRYDEKNVKDHSHI